MNSCLTRMHSSRMRTGRSLTVCWGRVCLVPGGFLPAGGVCLVPGGVSPCRGGLPGPGGVCLETPPVNRITHTCKNITLATTSLRPVNIRRFHGKKCDRSSKSNRIMKCINFNIDLMRENLVPAGCPVITLIPHVTVSIICGYYRPQRSCGQGYVFTGVCDSVHRGGLQRTPPGPGRHPPSRENPPPDQADTPPAGRTPPPGTRQTHTPPRQGEPPRQADPPGKKTAAYGQ